MVPDSHHITRNHQDCRQRDKHGKHSRFVDSDLSISGRLRNTMCLKSEKQSGRSVPGKLAVRCSTRASWLTGLWAEFIAEMAKHKISPSGMNCDWLIGDILIGDTSPAGGGGGGGGGEGTSTTVRS